MGQIGLTGFLLRSNMGVALMLGLLLAGCGGSPSPGADPVVVSKVNSKVNIAVGSFQALRLGLEAGQRVEGAITVGGDVGADVDFGVTDPLSHDVVRPDRVSGVRDFSFGAASTGSYVLMFDNGQDFVTPKVVQVVAQVWSK